ncbi:hypothetical protein LY76DRAFT_597130 [Colletotrichum caudatum]|nr:hypothetical protein LY76DRAFT_597130 [Colletotrichum caudatum]
MPKKSSSSSLRPPHPGPGWGGHGALPPSITPFLAPPRSLSLSLSIKRQGGGRENKKEINGCRRLDGSRCARLGAPPPPPPPPPVPLIPHVRLCARQLLL